MKPCFRYGQPIGTALIILAFVETIYSSFWLLLDYVSLEQTSSYNFFNGTAEFEFFGHMQWHSWLAFHFLISCLFWIAVVFESKKYFLYAWLITSLVLNVLFTTVIVTQSIFRPRECTVQATLVYVALGFFIVWRLYTMSVACQGLRRIRNKYDLRSDSVSDLDVCMEPIGCGFFQTWEFYKDLPGAGAVTLLTVELLWNAVNLCTRPLVLQMFGLGILQLPLEYLEGIGDFLLIEETVVRCVRILLDVLGIYFLFKEKLAAVRIWVCLYFLVFVASNVFASFMIVHWWTSVPEIPTIVYHVCILVFDNVYRIFVLYFTIKYGMVHVRTIAKL